MIFCKKIKRTKYEKRYNFARWQTRMINPEKKFLIESWFIPIDNQILFYFCNKFFFGFDLK